MTSTNGFTRPFLIVYLLYYLFIFFYVLLLPSCSTLQTSKPPRRALHNRVIQPFTGWNLFKFPLYLPPCSPQGVGPVGGRVGTNKNRLQCSKYKESSNPSWLIEGKPWGRERERERKLTISSGPPEAVEHTNIHMHIHSYTHMLSGPPVDQPLSPKL